MTWQEMNQVATRTPRGMEVQDMVEGHLTIKMILILKKFLECSLVEAVSTREVDNTIQEELNKDNEAMPKTMTPWYSSDNSHRYSLLSFFPCCQAWLKSMTLEPSVIISSASSRATHSHTNYKHQILTKSISWASTVYMISAQSIIEKPGQTIVLKMKS